MMVTRLSPEAEKRPAGVAAGEDVPGDELAPRKEACRVAKEEIAAPSGLA